MRLSFVFSLIALGACTRTPSEESTKSTHALSAPEPTGGPVCAENARRCTFTFTYVDHGETSVEVRGDFAEGAWKSGVAMTKRGKTWSADVDVPYGKDVQYKFFLDGKTWTKDPAHPTAVGTDNSGLDAITCNPHRCAP